MPLTLVQLTTFARLAERGSYTRVAEDLYLTQPAVTQQIHALERHFDVALVDVVGRKPYLTDAGLFLATRARDVLASVEVVEREMKEFAALDKGELHFGATLTVGAYVVPALLARFSQLYPRLTLSVAIENTKAMAERVRGGVLPLALVEGPLPEPDPDLDIVPFQDDRLVLAAPPDHPFAARERVTPAELVQTPMIWRERGSGTRLLAEQALRDANVSPRFTLELPSGEGIARAVESGLGVSLISVLVVERAIAAGRLVAVPVDGLNLSRTLRLVTPRGRTLSPAARAFTALVLDSAART